MIRRADNTPLPELDVQMSEDSSFSPVAIVRRLDGIEREIRGFKEWMQESKEVDERFKKLDHDFNIAKWIAGLALIAAIGTMVQAIGARISVRLNDSPPTASTAERMGADRVPAPHP